MIPLEPIRVRQYGCTGPTLLVLDGGPGAPGSAAGLACLLASHFSVMEPLQRRSGGVSLSVFQHVQDLAEIAPKQAMVVGWSWGAMLGLSYASRYPNRVSQLALVGCGTYDEASRTLYSQTLEQRQRQTGDFSIAELKQRLSEEQDAQRRDVLLAQLGAAYGRLQSYEWLPETLDLPEKLAVDRAGNTETWQDVLRLQREGVEPQAFSHIKIPVLMLHGDYDAHPGVATFEVLRQFIPHLEFTLLKNCGHEPWREAHARDEFLKRLVHWLKPNSESQSIMDGLDNCHRH